jgi:hypothetical protein
MQFKLAAVVCGVVFAGAVIAAEQGSVEVGGSLESTVTTGDNVNVASGQDVSTELAVGGTEGNVKVGGGFKQTVQTGDNVVVGEGQNVEASTRIGVIGGK